MNNIIKRVWIQNRLVNIEDLTGMVFQAEIGAHTFEISGIDDTGAAVALSGTVSGVFRRPDNADIALTGAASGGVVSVTLPADCYAVPGRFGLTIFVTSNSQKVAVYACVGTVAVSSTGNVAGDTPANVEDLIDDINAAIADLNSAIGQIPASYANVMAAIAPTYSGSALYPVGAYAWYNGSLYRCITAITTAEAWTAGHWTAAVLGNDVGDLKSAFDEFSGADGISGQSINGSANIETPITETITQNNYWYPTGSQTIANGGARAGIDKAVFDITNMSGKIAIGFDPNASYGSGSMVVGLSSSTVSPYTRVNYFSVSNVQTSPQYFTVNGNVVIADLDAIKSAYPTAVLMFVNIPHDVWKLDNITTFKKTLHWLSIAGYVPSIVVAADGSGDYTTISAAVAAAKDEDTIYIKDGKYTETVVVNKYLHIVGQSKQGTILQQDIGDYNNCPLLITQGSVCNMTIKSLAPADTSGLTGYAYAIHLDKNFASQAKYQKCEIYNCDIYSEVNDAIGAGTNYATEYDVHDCFLHVAHNPVKTGACGFKCHNGQNQTTGKVTLRNNIIITEDANGTSCYDILFHNGGISNTQPIEILMVGNVLKYYHNNITNIFVPSAYNYGNSVAAMNALS